MMFNDGVATARTIEEGVEVVVVNFTKFEKVFARFWTRIYFEINDNVTERCLEQDRHDRGWCAGWLLEEEDKCDTDHT